MALRAQPRAQPGLPRCRRAPASVPLPLPRWPVAGAWVGAAPRQGSLPPVRAESASTTALARPARDSLTLRPARLQAHHRGPCVSGASPRRIAPTRRPGSYRGVPTLPRVELSSTGPLRLFVAHPNARRFSSPRRRDGGPKTRCSTAIALLVQSSHLPAGLLQARVRPHVRYNANARRNPASSSWRRCGDSRPIRSVRTTLLRVRS